MGRTVSLYSAAAISLDEFRRFTADVGGEIFDEDDLDIHISANDCHVWIYCARRCLSGNFEEPEEEDVAEILGAPIKVALHMELSHEHGSGPLALRVARQFAHKWPSVVSLASYDAMTAGDIKSGLRAGRLPLILSPTARLVFQADPKPEHMIEQIGGIVLDPGDLAMLASAERELRLQRHDPYDPARERILGFFPAGEAYAWVLGRISVEGPGMPEVDMDKCLFSLAMNRLQGRPAEVVRVLFGYDLSREAERDVFLFAAQMFRVQPGVMVSIFNLVLDKRGIDKMIESGQEKLIA